MQRKRGPLPLPVVPIIFSMFLVNCTWVASLPPPQAHSGGRPWGFDDAVDVALSVEMLPAPDSKGQHVLMQEYLSTAVEAEQLRLHLLEYAKAYLAQRGLRVGQHGPVVHVRLHELRVTSESSPAKPGAAALHAEIEAFVAASQCLSCEAQATKRETFPLTRAEFSPWSHADGIAPRLAGLTAEALTPVVDHLLLRVPRQRAHQGQAPLWVVAQTPSLEPTAELLSSLLSRFGLVPLSGEDLRVGWADIDENVLQSTEAANAAGARAVVRIVEVLSETKLLLEPVGEQPCWEALVTVGDTTALLDVAREITARMASEDLCKPPAAAPTPEGAEVTVNTVPKGATVFVNQHLLGPAPVESASLPPGEHMIRAERRGYRPAFKAVRLAPGDARAMRLSLPALVDRSVRLRFGGLQRAYTAHPDTRTAASHMTTLRLGGSYTQSLWGMLGWGAEAGWAHELFSPPRPLRENTAISEAYRGATRNAAYGAVWLQVTGHGLDLVESKDQAARIRWNLLSGSLRLGLDYQSPSTLAAAIVGAVTMMHVLEIGVGYHYTMWGLRDHVNVDGRTLNAAGRGAFMVTAGLGWAQVWTR